LLKAIAASGSLAAAVLECRISYRAGWGLLRDYREKLSGPLVVFQRGRGGRLTAAGKQLLHVHADATQKLDRVLSELSVDIGPDRAVMDEP
jgi:molybdate transport repressor ModE-like protein